MSPSPSLEFWRRWHISLTNWFREYVYIPLGGNRQGTSRTIFNLAVVWALTGIWHGEAGTFAVGLYFLVFILLERFVLKARAGKASPVDAARLHPLVVFIGWGLFAMEDMGQLGQYFRALFGFGAGAYHPEAGYWLRSYGPPLIILTVASTSLGAKLWKQPGRKILEPARALAGLILSTACLVDATYNPFLYLRILGGVGA